MNFKEVRLFGFKSFADKTSIKFDDGVTCIVGPNGCGKSNVADAVRWVLGEQSAKNLRGSNMQDVIFGGTETRRQLSFCEVTLVFDNSQKIFDIDYDEVEMTRRLYRSGDSEYLLNRQVCRLKDIVTLLHGVGIGKEGYSIIGQGKVAQIMNSKPEDRRSIFEEATGVIRFKSQKAEVERKLSSARENLSVFVQRIDEAETQLRPLEKQAETAKKYREFSEQLKYEEVNAYLIRSDGFAQETERYQARIATADAELSRIDTRLSVVDAEETAGRLRIAEEDDRLRRINEQLREFEVNIERKTGESNVMTERIRSCRVQLEQANRDIDASVRRTEEIDALVQSGTETAEGSGKRAADIEEECKELIRKLSEADARVMLYEKISAEQRASELSSVENLADVRANVGSLSAKREAAQDRVEETRQAIEKAEARKTEFGRQLEECRKEKAELESALAKTSSEEQDLQADIEDLTRSEKRINEDIAECNTAISNLQNNLEMYIGLKNRFDGYRDSVRRLQLEARQNPEVGKRVKGAIADLVTTEKKYETAIETAFGGAMQNLVTATQDDARWLIEYLKRTGGGIVTFLPVDGMRPRPDSREVELALREEGALGLADNLVEYHPYYANVIKNLLGNTLICDNIANATRISKKFPRIFRIVTLDGDNIATSGAMTGGSRRKDSGNLLAGERNIKECEENISKKQTLLERLKKALAECSAELKEAKDRYEQFRNRVQEETANYAAVCQKEIAIAGLVGSAQADAEEYTALLERLTRTVSDLEGAVLSSVENEDLLNKIRAEAATESHEREKQIEKLKEERDALSNRLHELRVESATVTTGRSAAQDNITRLMAEKEDLLRRIEQNRALVLDLERTVVRYKQEAEHMALTEEERKTVAGLREALKTAEEEKRVLSERQKQLADEKSTLFSDQTAKSEERHAAEIEISKAQTTLENMKLRLEELYGLDYESAQSFRDPNYDFSQSNTNINSLRHKIAALGAVNQNAEEDYNNLLARYTDMQTQKEDLDKGIADLTGVLNDLREQMQKKFDDGFNQINANFTQIFKELFGGGRAEMQLDYTDCDDPLEAGVEIVACPPGKKLTKISLLSGGEQAFTAIAILFAILKTHPMPFCILDEIEAALDEANVDRFAKYLKKFSRDTQFIVITHRKPTMTQADTLFGVTMEEKGVSKIVSVKLSEVESRLGGDTVIA